MNKTPITQTCFSILLLSAAAFASQAQAAVLYEDNFSGTSGTQLLGRNPDTVDTPDNAYAGSSAFYLNGSGQAVAGTTASAGAVAMNLALPSITTNDIITLTLDFSASGGASTYVALGFTNAVGTLSNVDTSEMRSVIRADALARAYSNGNTNELYLNNTERYTGYTAITGGFQTDLTRLIMTFNANTGNLTITSTDLVTNATKTVYDGASMFSELESLQYATFQFHTQNPGESANPAYVDYFKVEISQIPEASTMSFLALGLAALLAFRLYRRRQA